MKNANLGLLVSTVVAVLGCWIYGWDIDDGNALPIVASSFGSGLLALNLLESRFPTKLPGRDSNSTSR
jgi:hypothetical protein